MDYSNAAEKGEFLSILNDKLRVMFDAFEHERQSEAARPEGNGKQLQDRRMYPAELKGLAQLRSERVNKFW